MILLEKIKKYIDDNRGGVSFAELSKIDGFNGDREISFDSAKFSNIIVWSGVSEEAVSSLRKLVDNKSYHFHPTSSLTYMADGAMLNIPIAKSVRHYKTPHWIPTVINIGMPPL